MNDYKNNERAAVILAVVGVVLAIIIEIAAFIAKVYIVKWIFTH